MKAVLSIELRGDNVRQLWKLGTWKCNQIEPGLGEKVLGLMPPSAWCAQITGRDKVFRYARKFLPFKKDYSSANSKGSRGVMAVYVLDEGRVYDVKEHRDRYFCAVKDWEVVKIDESEVEQWLNSHSV